MRIVVAMDSFKDSLTAVEACEIVAGAIGSAVPAAEIVIKPMADGGEGTAEAMLAAGNGKWVERAVTWPLLDMQVDAGFVWFEDREEALVEMAKASGLVLLPAGRRNPMKTTTYGTGQLIAAAVDYGARRVFLAVGGSSTVDCGTGAAAALGWRFLDEKDREIVPCGGELLRISKIVPPSEPPFLPLARGRGVEVLCDVDNPLCGKHGAARVYAPQKGATEEMVEQLEAGLEHIAELVKEQLGCDIRDVPGGGAAGGLSAGAVAFMGGRLVSGIESVMSQSRLTEALTGADWVITGEGKFDHQSLWGKVACGVVRLAGDTGTKVAVLAGQVLLERWRYREFGVTDAIGCMSNEMTLEYAIENSERLLAEAAKKFAVAQLGGKPTV